MHRWVRDPGMNILAKYFVSNGGIFSIHDPLYYDQKNSPGT